MLGYEGLAYCPAIRPNLITGNPVDCSINADICDKVNVKSRIIVAWQSSKDSAQSPPCRRKASPFATSFNKFLNALISEAKISGGIMLKAFSLQ